MQTHYSIATFNVRIFNRIGQLQELTASAIDHCRDISTQEHRYIHSEDYYYGDTGNGWTLVSASAWKNSVNDKIGGVGMLIGPRVRRSLNSIVKIQPRMILSIFNDNPSAIIISCYSPTIIELLYNNNNK